MADPEENEFCLLAASSSTSTTTATPTTPSGSDSDDQRWSSDRYTACTQLLAAGVALRVEAQVVHHVAEADAGLGVGERERSARAGVAERTSRGLAAPNDWPSMKPSPKQLSIISTASLPHACSTVAAATVAALQRAHAVDLADARRVQPGERTGVADAVRRRQLGRVQRARVPHLVVPEQAARVGEHAARAAGRRRTASAARRGRARAARGAATRGSISSGRPIQKSRPSGSAISSRKNAPIVRAGRRGGRARRRASRTCACGSRAACPAPRSAPARRAPATIGSHASASSSVKSPSTSGRPAWWLSTCATVIASLPFAANSGQYVRDRRVGIEHARARSAGWRTPT